MVIPNINSQTDEQLRNSTMGKSSSAASPQTPGVHGIGTVPPEKANDRGQLEEKPQDKENSF